MIEAETTTHWTREKIESFLADEELRYQKIQLPFGLSTPGGSEREETLRIAFGDDLEGKSVLDIGSYLGYFCLAARERNAGRVVGWEIDFERRRMANTLAEIKGLEVEYRGGDVETTSGDERFDVVLCLNVLHHLRNPIAVLDKLTRMTKNKLVLEVATLGRHDRKKFSLSAITAYLIARAPVMLVGRGDTSGRSRQQKFFLTRSAVERLLVHQRNAFARVDFIDSGFKGRFLVVAKKRRVDNLIVVAGPTSSGKSTMIDELRAGHHSELARRLGIESLEGLPFLGASKLARDETVHYSRLIYHYDFLRPFGRSAKTHDRDEALDLLNSAKRISFVTLNTPPEQLRAQLQKGELSVSKPSTRHKRIAKLYEREETIRSLYREWFDYIDSRAGYIDGEIGARVVVERDGVQPGSSVHIVDQDSFTATSRRSNED
jgi:2-polyprenyl-3-methyl-5-hydroxy-6-metoxy-1,4-benzoquinol methylase